jgi:phage shock protein PspC (stress-responsive transcriptional regulator)
MSEAEQLDRLGELHRRGVLSDEEFTRAKARVLSGAAVAGADDRLRAGVNALTRSRADRWIGGVCGGIARATGVASWVWRVVFTALAICGGSGLVIYLLLWIFVPLANAEVGPTRTPTPAS